MKLKAFFEKFDQFADAPDAVAKVRELILQFAVIGKLCRQDSSEEPASTLLRKIAARNKSRYASGELRLRENARLSEDLDVSVPEGWSSVALGEIADVNWGNTSLTKKSYSPSGFTAYSATGPDGWIDHADFSGPGIVLSAIGARSGKCFLAEGQWTAIKNTITIIPFSPINNEWLFRAINRETAWKKRGGAQPFIALKDAVSLPLLLPPLAEQERIVAKVDEFMALCDRLETQLQEGETRCAALARASLDRFADAPTLANLNFLFHPSYAIPPSDLRKSILTLAVQGKLAPQDPSDEDASKLLGQIRVAKSAAQKRQRSRSSESDSAGSPSSEPYELPIGWVWTALGEVQVFTNGYAFKSEDYQESGIGIVRMGELGLNGEIDESDMKRVSEEIAQSLPDMYQVRPGDLLMGMSGSIGKLAINCSTKTYLLNQRVGRLEPILIEKRYLHVFLRTVEQHYLEISFGMAIKNLSTKQINETAFPLPPLAEQCRIVAKVEQLMALVDDLETQLATSRATAANLLDAVVAELTAKG